MDYFFKSYHHHIVSTDRLIICVSGGVDSMVLLDLFLRVHPKEHIVVAHFDHMLRGIESDRDREFVEKYCHDRGLVCEVVRRDIQMIWQSEKCSLEAVARRERYAWFGELREKYKARYIVTAHHLDDQVETFFLSLVKGGKVHGLSGMREVSTQSVYRPMLHIPKSEILSYAEKTGTMYRNDMTNSDVSFDRNRIRKDILPVFEVLNPAIRETIGRLTEYFSVLDDSFEQDVNYWLQKESKQHGSGMFSVSSFSECSDFFRKELLARLYRIHNDGSAQGLSVGLLEEGIRYVLTANGGTEKCLGNLHLEKRGGLIKYCKDTESDSRTIVDH